MEKEVQGGRTIGSKVSPGTLTIILMVLGCSVLVLSIYNQPFPNGRDMDGDGISDNFQKVQPVEDIVKDGDEWRIETVGYTSDMDLPFLIFSGAALMIIIPVSIGLWRWDGPRRAEKVRKWIEEGRMHDAVRRLAAFLEINPSLSSAVKLTRTSMPGKDQSVLGSLVWAPVTEGRPFDEVYSEFSSTWSVRSPHIGSALAGLSSAEKEAGRAEVMISARSVIERLSESSKALMENYSRSLTGPSTALFGVGVLLPILLATMIPVAGITGRTALILGAFLWFVLPAGILLVGNGLVLKRPSLGSSILSPTRSKFNARPGDAALIILGTFSILFAILTWTDPGKIEMLEIKGLDRSSFSVLAFMIGLSFSSAGIISVLARGPQRSEKEFIEVRSRSPRILRDISSSIQEGHSFEHALKRTMAVNTISGDMTRIPMPGETLEGVCYPEPLSSFLESAREFSRAGKGAGGRAVRAFSRHIKELQDLERDLSSRVRSAVGQMEVTASIFAPLMIGISAGIFTLMDSISSEVPDGMLFGGASASTMGPWQFLLLAGGYLMMLSVATTLTIFRLERGRTDGGWHRVPRRLVQSSLAFTAGTILSSILMS